MIIINIHNIQNSEDLNLLKAERAKFIMDFLERSYPETPVPLINNNIFELLVAVLLSAQCTDERVNKITPTLFKIANNPFDMEKTNIHEVIEDAVEHVKLIVESNKGSINLSLNADNSNILGNSNHLENIIINILDNAVKYSKSKPSIIVSTRNIDDNIEICVQDNGIGMDKNTQKMVFEKFYREQNGDIHDIKGHGLGLSYVKKIVDFHKGKIMLESKKGSGTKFYINIKTLKDEIR